MPDRFSDHPKVRQFHEMHGNRQPALNYMIQAQHAATQMHQQWEREKADWIAAGGTIVEPVPGSFQFIDKDGNTVKWVDW